MSNMCEMEILDSSGHSKTTWNPEVRHEVDQARATFDALKGKGYRAFRVKRDGNEGEPMSKFDPEAGAMILMVPPVQGG